MGCTVDKCDGAYLAKGFCRKHYQRMYKNGTLELLRGGPAEGRFWTKVDKRGPDECWPWTAGLTQTTEKVVGGYGKFTDASHRTVMAHRFAYELLVGPIPEGFDLDHVCHTRDRDTCTNPHACLHRRCVNPAHLEPVTCRINLLRGNGWQRKNAEATHCPDGHPYDVANTYINPRGERQCRKCRALQAAARRAKRGGNEAFLSNFAKRSWSV